MPQIPPPTPTLSLTDCDTFTLSSAANFKVCGLAGCALPDAWRSDALDSHWTYDDDYDYC